MNYKILLITLFTISNIFIITGCIEDNIKNDKYNIYVGLNIDYGYSKIQDAIFNASDGDSIFIFNGIYNETLIINKSLKIIGESKDNTIINFDGNNTNEIDLILISKDNCIIDGIKIYNPKKNKNVRGIVIESSNNTIINNTVANIDKGILITTENAVNVNSNLIISNNLSNNNYGLNVRYSDLNNITDNIFYSNKEYGIYLLGSNDNILSDNNFTENNYGIRIKGSTKNELYNNSIFYNDKGLYFCCGARNNLVFNNNFMGNNEYNGKDAIGNKWDNGIVGNYWDDYQEKYPDSEITNGIWSIPYNITGGNYLDNFPLVNPIIKDK
jgi:parallel beta-helix repeat protein